MENVSHKGDFERQYINMCDLPINPIKIDLAGEKKDFSTESNLKITNGKLTVLSVKEVK